MPGFEVFHNLGLELHVDRMAMIKWLQCIEESFNAIAWIVGIRVNTFQFVKDDKELTTEIVKSSLTEVE